MGPRARVVALAVGGLGVATALLGAGVVRWLGVAIVIATVGPLWHEVARHPWWQRRRDRMPLALLAAMAVLMVGPLLLGDPPASRDHSIHYFQMKLLVEELLPSGRLWGWSPSLNHGYPFGESYPVLGYLWMSAAHLLSFGLVSLRTSYAWGLASLWMVSAGVTWWTASLVIGELRGSAEAAVAGDAAADDPATHDDAGSDSAPPTPSRRAREVAGWAGLVAAAAWLLDPGGSREGGWNYLMFHGVWPQLVSTTLWVASLGLTLRAFASPTPRRVAAATLVLGGALLGHPFGLLTMTVSMLGWAVLVLVGPRARRWPGPWRTWLVVHVGATLLAAGWLATFFTSAQEMARSPVPWLPLAEVGSAIVRGELLQGHWAWTAPLALVGAVVVVRRGGTLGWAVLGIAIGQLVLASQDAITVLRLDLVVSGFKNLQFPRYTIPFKPLWFALAGVGAGRLWSWAQAHRAASRALARAQGASDPRPDADTDADTDTAASDAPGPAPSWTAIAWIRRGLVGLLLAPLLATLAPETGRLLARPVAAIDTLGRGGMARPEAALLQTLQREAQALPPDRPMVVALMRSGMGGATFPLYSITDVGARLVLDAHVPAVNFKHRVLRGPRTYALLGVTHVLRDRDLQEREQPLAAMLEPIDHFGPFTLERFSPPADLAPWAPASLRGPGTITVERDEPERLVLDVSGAEPGTTLLLHRAPHHRWEVTHDGTSLPTFEHNLGAPELRGIGVELPGPGRVELRYHVGGRERRAAWLSALTLLGLLVALTRRGPSLATRPLGPSARRVSWIVAGLGVSLAVGGVVLRQRDKLEETWTEVAVDRFSGDAIPPQFVRDLVLDGALDIELDPPWVCSGLLGKDAREGCSEDAHRPNLSFLYREPYMYRCLRISIAPKGSVTVTFPDLVDDDGAILGSLVRHVELGSGKQVLWGFDRARVPIRNQRREVVVRRRRDGTMPTLRLENLGWSIEQVCLSAGEIRRQR